MSEISEKYKAVEIEFMIETIKFLFPYAKKAFDLEVNIYPEPLFRFAQIEEYINDRTKYV